MLDENLPGLYVRLHSAIGYVTPNDMLAGRQAQIHAERDRKLEEARTTPTSDLGGCRAPIAELSVNLHGQCRILQLDFWWAAPRALEEVHDLVTGTL